MQARVVYEGLDLQHELLRLPQVVGVQKRQKLAMRSFDARIPCCTRSCVCLVVVVDRSAKFLNNGRGVIGRTVVNDNDVDRAIGLGQHAFDRLPHISLAVEDRDDDADEVTSFSRHYLPIVLGDLSSECQAARGWLVSSLSRSCVE